MFEYTISAYGEIADCCRAMTARLGLEELPEYTAYTLRLALDELATNVLKHSHCKAEVSCCAEEGLLVLTVRGNCGFCPKRVPPPDLFSECGRGIFLVRSLCDLEYLEGGKTAVAKIQMK